MTTILMIGILLLLASPLRADQIRTAGDYLQIGIPAYAIGRAVGDRDHEGLRQMGNGFLTNTLTTGVLKETTLQLRPDGGDRRSFPSGHTSAAFQGAAFVHRRYGLEEAWPLYAGATFVGYSRVHARRHYWRDVIAGAAVGIGSSWLMTEPKKDYQLLVNSDGKSLQLSYHRRFD